MKSYNLAILPESDRAEIELQKQARAIVYNLRRSTINRADVKLLIEKSLQSEKLRDLINQYRKER